MPGTPSVHLRSQELSGEIGFCADKTEVPKSFYSIRNKKKDTLFFPA